MSMLMTTRMRLWRRAGAAPRALLSGARSIKTTAKKVPGPGRVRGTRDLLPEVAESHRGVVQQLQAVVDRYGFRQVQTPMLEYTDLFSRSLGDGSDIVMKEMYTFPDNSGKSVTLRPEGTAGVIRAMLSNNLLSTLPQKVSYHGSMFRYERPQRGRYREFQQFGVEFVGSTGPSVDAEVIGMAAHALEDLGILDSTSLQINSLGDSESRNRYRVALEEYFAQYRGDLSADSVSRLDRGSVLRILDSKSEADQSIVAEAPRLKQFLSTESLERFDAVLSGLAVLGVKFEENMRLVRGLDYYSHTVFEFVEQLPAETNDSQRSSGIAVLAGGCYDDLTALLGGPQVSCIGWAAGVDRLGLLRGDVYQARRTIAVIPVLAGVEGNAVMNEALRAAQVLRKCGHNVHVCHGKGNMKKQMKAADRYGSGYAVIIGGDELQRKQFKIKNLAKREEVDVSMEALAAFDFV